MKTRLIILAAPSGAGKSSFVDKICAEEPRLVDTITYTTRQMRRGESQGKPYYFVDKAEFEKRVKDNYFVEWAMVHENMYGTPMEQLTDAWKQNKCIIMDVDVQGAATFKEKFPDAAMVFILPPSMEELRRRIIKRDGENAKDLDLRLRNAEAELRKASEFDILITNDNFEMAFAEFKKIVEDLLSDE